jgi:hypothetical protein
MNYEIDGIFLRPKKNRLTISTCYDVLPLEVVEEMKLSQTSTTTKSYSLTGEVANEESFSSGEYTISVDTSEIDQNGSYSLTGEVSNEESFSLGEYTVLASVTEVSGEYTIEN